jgi:hypothetical protein
MVYNTIRHYTYMRILFLLWFFTLPVGSYFLSFSFPYFTVYPNLILGCILALMLLPSWSLHFNFNTIIVSYGLLLLLYALGMSILQHRLNEAKFDLRSLGMQFLTALLILRYAEQFSYKSALLDCKIGLKACLYAILLFGVLEFLSGIHIYGKHTELLKTLTAGPLFYAPVFVFDNPNDYLMCVLFLFQLVVLMDHNLQRSPAKIFAVMLVIWIFSDAASCQFAKLNLCIIGIIYSIHGFETWRVTLRAWMFPIVCFTLMFSAVYWSHIIFFGPKFQDAKHYRLNSILLLEKKENSWRLDSARNVLSLKEQISVENYLDSVNTKGTHKSEHLRWNLILQGMVFIKQHVIFGLGPGGFKNALLQHSNKLTGPHVSPHNFPIEIISQYGIMGGLYFMILLLLGFKLHKALKAAHQPRVYFISLLLSMPIIWSMSSAYLYQFTHWLLLPVCFVYYKFIQSNAEHTTN